MAQKPSIPKGTRDFSPVEVAKRNYILATIRKHFELYGFQPIETPSFENSSTLMGKYGEEGDRLIFKILNSGDYLAKVDLDKLHAHSSSDLTPLISEKALRYDLTVPFARYVVQHQNEIEFPFKRYQMQPVWRADRPQKGRYREFYQCDADVVGSNSLWQEVEFIQLYDAIFTELGIASTIKLNNRKILSGIAEVIGAKDKLIDFTVALDKLDKIGEDGVVTEMLSKGIGRDAIEQLKPLFTLTGKSEEKLEKLKGLLSKSDEGQQGVEDLQFILKSVTELGLGLSNLQVDITLARGLNYYTGAIFEVLAKEVEMGSIGGGGRYDDLTGIFGLKDMSGIGISFGVDRIYLVLEELNLFKTAVDSPKPQVLFLNFGTDEAAYGMQALKRLRDSGIKAEMYPDAVKIKKQLNYANKCQIPFVVLVGEEELRNEKYTLKNMNSGEQQLVDLNELLQTVENS